MRRIMEIILILLSTIFFIFGVFRMASSPADVTTAIFCLFGLPALPWVGLVVWTIVSSIYQKFLVEPKKVDEEKLRSAAYKKVYEQEKQRLISVKHALVENDDFVWGHLPIVKCANGHKYRYSEFRYVSASKRDTTYDEVTTRTEGRVSAVYSGGHMYPVIQGGSSSTRYVPKTTATPIYTIGCPLCHTSIYTFEYPFSNSLIDDYILCSGEDCFCLAPDADYDTMKQKYGPGVIPGHWNGTEYVPVLYRKKYARCPLNETVDYSSISDVVNKILPKQVTQDDIIENLVGLGYNRNESRRAAKRALIAALDKTNSTVVLKLALDILTGLK